MSALHFIIDESPIAVNLNSPTVASWDQKTGVLVLGNSATGHMVSFQILGNDFYSEFSVDISLSCAKKIADEWQKYINMPRKVTFIKELRKIVQRQVHAVTVKILSDDVERLESAGIPYVVVMS